MSGALGQYFLVTLAAQIFALPLIAYHSARSRRSFDR